MLLNGVRLRRTKGLESSVRSEKYFLYPLYEYSGVPVVYIAGTAEDGLPPFLVPGWKLRLTFSAEICLDSGEQVACLAFLTRSVRESHLT